MQNIVVNVMEKNRRKGALLNNNTIEIVSTTKIAIFSKSIF